MSKKKTAKKKPVNQPAKKQKPSALETAQEIGYNRGWNDAEAVPTGAFAVLRAQISYGKGLKARQKAMKIEKQIEKDNKRLQALKGARS